jgi:glutaredoxin
MGVVMNPRKRRMLLTAAAAIITIFVVFLTSSQSFKTSSEITIPNLSKSVNSDKLLKDNAAVQIPGSKKNLTADLDKKKHTTITNTESAKVATKKVTNNNDSVKNKAGLIDESKVREAETKNESRKIPLVAGDPTSKKAHDKSSSDELISKQSIKEHSEESPNDINNSNNGIKADKGLGSIEQKEIHDKEIDEKKTKFASSSSSNLNSNSKPVNANNAAMIAQENAEKNGVSKDNGSSFNPKKEYEKILTKSPVVIFSKSYCPYSKKLKNLLKTEYHISPEPIIIELDNHENGKELQQHIGEETGRFTVPNFIIDGKSRGGADDIVALHENDELIDIFHAWSAGSAKIKKLGEK